MNEFALVSVCFAIFCPILMLFSFTHRYTFEVAPSFLVMEREVYRKMHNLCGWDGGDGMFCPGGSMSNFYGEVANEFL